MRVDAHALPFGRGSFDAIVSIDAWEYFGTGDHYPPYLATFLKPGGQLGVATPALTTEVRELGEIPEHIDRVVGAESAAWHTAEWLRSQWEFSRAFASVTARNQPDACANWLLWERAVMELKGQPTSPVQGMLEADGGAFVTLRARHREGRMSLDATDLGHLRRAVELARLALERGDEPFGSVLVSGDGEVLFEDHNHVVALDATQHPEFAIARWAGAHLTAAERAAATVYTSGEHCPMCSAAHAWVGLGRIAYAVSSAQLGAWRSAWGAAASPVARALDPRRRAGRGRRRAGPGARGRGPRPPRPLRPRPPLTRHPAYDRTQPAVTSPPFRAPLPRRGPEMEGRSQEASPHPRRGPQVVAERFESPPLPRRGPEMEGRSQEPSPHPRRGPEMEGCGERRREPHDVLDRRLHDSTSGLALPAIRGACGAHRLGPAASVPRTVPRCVRVRLRAAHRCPARPCRTSGRGAGQLRLAPHGRAAARAQWCPTIPTST